MYIYKHLIRQTVPSGSYDPRIMTWRFMAGLFRSFFLVPIIVTREGAGTNKVFLVPETSFQALSGIAGGPQPPPRDAH